MIVNVLTLPSILLGASSLSLVVVYPLMKRITHWPQAVLGALHRYGSLQPILTLGIGLAFNWGALLGWSAVAGAVDWRVCLPLYAGGVCWTLVYDSIYAHQVRNFPLLLLVVAKYVCFYQDKKDDVSAGIRSTAILFGANSRLILSGLSASSMSFITLAGYFNGQTAPFYVGVALATAQLARVLVQTDFDDRESCWSGFVGCGWSGWWIWAGALTDYLLALACI